MCIFSSVIIHGMTLYLIKFKFVDVISFLSQDIVSLYPQIHFFWAWGGGAECLRQRKSNSILVLNEILLLFYYMNLICHLQVMNCKTFQIAFHFLSWHSFIPFQKIWDIWILWGLYFDNIHFGHHCLWCSRWSFPQPWCSWKYSLRTPHCT